MLGASTLRDHVNQLTNNNPTISLPNCTALPTTDKTPPPTIHPLLPHYKKYASATLSSEHLSSDNQFTKKQTSASTYKSLGWMMVMVVAMIGWEGKEEEDEEDGNFGCCWRIRVQVLQVRTNLSNTRFPPRPIVFRLFRLLFIHKYCQNQGTHLLFHTQHLSHYSVLSITRGL